MATIAIIVLIIVAFVLLSILAARMESPEHRKDKPSVSDDDAEE